MKPYVVRTKEIEPVIRKGRADRKGISTRFLITDQEAPNTHGCLLRVTLAPGGFHARHLHTKADEFVYIISGQGKKGLGDKIYDIEPGLTFYIPKGIEHWMLNTSKDKTIEVLAVFPSAPNIDETGYEYLGPIETKDI